MGSKTLAKYYSFFLCLNIFLPKIDFGAGQFYVFDFVNVILFGYFISRGKLFLRSNVILSYIGFMAACYMSYVVGLLNFEFIDSTSLFRLIKFTIFILYLVVPYYVYDAFSAEDLKKIINYQILFIFLAGLYTIYHMVFYPMTSNDYAWGYDNRYRLIGFTSYSLDLNGTLRQIGSTSVSMGVFVAFIFFILLSFYKFYQKRTYLVLAILIFLLEFLTYSRAGILVLLTGLCYYAILNLKPSLIVRISVMLFFLISFTLYLNATDKLSNFGTLSKITNFSLQTDHSILTRVNMLAAGLQYMWEHPQTILIGSGYGEDYTIAAIGYSHLEGLLPTTLMTSGILAVIFILVHFYSLWDIAKKYSLIPNTDFRPFLYAIRIFIPGWFLSASMAGNTFQTDYYFPLIYFVFFVSYFKVRETVSLQKS